MNLKSLRLIVKKHLETFLPVDKNFNRIDGSFSKQDTFTYLILPLTISSVLTYKNFDLDKQVGNLISIISIFGGFLFNLMAIIYNYLDRPSSSQVRERRLYANEINANISFGALLSIVCVLLLIIYNSIPEKILVFENLTYPIFHIKQFFLGITSFCLLHFLLTLLMILGRVFILLQIEMRDK